MVGEGLCGSVSSWSGKGVGQVTHGLLPSVNRITDMIENITFPHTMYMVGN